MNNQSNGKNRRQQPPEYKKNTQKGSGSSDRSAGKRPVSYKAVSSDRRASAGMAYESVRPGRSKRRKSKTPIIVLLFAVLILAIVFGGYGIYQIMLKPVSNDTTLQIVEIPEGSTTTDISSILADQGLIRNSMVFQSYVGRHSRGTNGLQAGNYEISPSMSVEEIFTKMVNGDTYSGAIPVVLPEGRNIREMAAILQEHNICSADAFIEETHKLSEYKQKYPILSTVSDAPERFLEGYLYPDTYNFEPGSEPSLIVSTMLDRFTEVWNSEFAAQAQAKGKTVDEIVIMASMIELETKLPEDKPLAASVFYNRIAQNMPLQSDITIDYALGEKHEVLTTEQTQYDSPYNTYIHTGLPVGPICSPGHASIDAALNPAETNYLYFVADMDTGKLHFNETLEGHNADVEKYMGD